MRTLCKQFWPLGILLIAISGVGCNSQDAHNLSQDTRHIVQDTGHALGSASLDSKVNSVLVLRKGVDMSGLHIEAQDGVVTLSGHVRNKQEKRRIADTVEGIRGVDKVIDQIRVEP